MNQPDPSNKMGLLQRIEDSLMRLWIDRVTCEASARGLLREAADALRAATEPCEAPSRYAFMEWAKTQGSYSFRLSDEPFRTYHHELTEHAWRGWANSRPIRSPRPAPPTRHERRVVGHASGWKEQMDTCVCGQKWPCPSLETGYGRGESRGCTCHYADGSTPPARHDDGCLALTKGCDHG